MAIAGGLRRFSDELDPGVVSTALTWHDDPELSELLARLIGHEERRRFFDAYAEAIVARHLLEHDCTIQFEVPTPSGRRCDFAVRTPRGEFFLHVKRLDTDRPHHRRISVSSRLRYLERIERPYMVSVRWADHLSDEQMQSLVTEGAAFLREARVGDEKIVLDEDGLEIGGLRVVAPGQGRFVTLTIGLPDGFVDESLRIGKLLGRAYQQFMPGRVNVILIGTSHEADQLDFEAALLGSHVERWDEHPPQGSRIAHGRDIDGFWSGRRFEASRAAGWFSLTHPDVGAALYLRDGDRVEQGLLEPVFGAVTPLPR